MSFNAGDEVVLITDPKTRMVILSVEGNGDANCLWRDAKQVDHKGTYPQVVLKKWVPRVPLNISVG
ncbi:hypothetical protein [Aeromonas sobria]|uniref:hypothetical protein n=1 Tax=Aeromonas sobria TaxID=646 RepID=UPI0012FF1FA6|nr:hypothetical protein [Aeromonas sobria]